MNTTNGAIVATVVAAIVFSCCVWSGYPGALRLAGPGPWGLDGGDLWPGDTLRFEDVESFERVEDSLELLRECFCFGAPAWAAISGAIVFWVLGRRRKSNAQNQVSRQGEKRV